MARLRSDDTIRVDGLKELIQSLKELGPEFRRELRKANKAVADFVATDSKAAATGRGSTAAKVAPSIKASAGADFAAVAGGGAGYPMFAGAEFGSAQGVLRQRKSGTYVGYNQFDPWAGGGAGTDEGGYFLWPTIRRDRERITTEYLAALDLIIKRAGLET